jgi:hypothetical protein
MNTTQLTVVYFVLHYVLSLCYLHAILLCKYITFVCAMLQYKCIRLPTFKPYPDYISTRHRTLQKESEATPFIICHVTDALSLAYYSV